MAVVFKQLNTTIPISDSVASHLTNAASKTLHIDGLYLHNTHSSSIEVTLYIVPDNAGAVGTAAVGNQFFKATLEANETYPINDVSIYLADEGDSLQAVAGTASKVNIFIEGEEVDV